MRDVFQPDGATRDVRIQMPDDDAWRRVLAFLWATDPTLGDFGTGRP